MTREDKHKHLGFIQAVVNRMSRNSFLLKGWSITLITAILALTVQNGYESVTAAFPYFVVLMFWSLDAYFLLQEKLYRDLYDEVRTKDESNIDFSMKTEDLDGNWARSWLGVAVSRTLLLFYAPLLSVVLLIMHILD